MSASAERAAVFAERLTTGVNTLALLADADATSEHMKAIGVADWRRDVLAAIVDLERSCEVLEPRTTAATFDEIRGALSSLLDLLKASSWNLEELSAASADCLKRLLLVLGG